MNTFQRSWQLFKASWAVLSADRELMLFPVISGFVMIVVTLVFLLPVGVIFGLLGATSGSEGLNEVIGFALLFLFYMVGNSISIYFNSALVGAAMIRIDGGDPTLRDGLRLANKRWKSILMYAAISATVGVVLQAIRERAGFLGSIISSLGGMAWNLATFFVVPILVVQDISPWEAVKASTALLKRTWGEQVVSTGGIGLVTTLAVIAAIIVGGLATFLLANINGTLAGVMLFVTILAVIVISVASSALNGILRAIVYRYAETGTVPDNFDIDAIRGVFGDDKKKKN